MSRVLQLERQSGTNTFTYVVPAGPERMLKWVFVEYVAHSTGGTRDVRLKKTNSSGDMLYEIFAGASLANNDNVDLVFQPGVPRETTETVTQYAIPIPHGMVFKPGEQVVIEDFQDASASDTMTVSLTLMEF